MTSESSSGNPKQPLLRRMTGRDANAAHRAATPLELLYDLVFVVAIAQAAHALHHAIDHGDGLKAVMSYAMAFFAIWWAWMGFTWFASAFDTDDPLYRVKVFVQMCGLLTLAAGVSKVFKGDFTYVIAGYVVMRLGLVTQWLRAAISSTEYRQVALRYAIGIVLCQVGWILFAIFASGTARPVDFVVLMLLELLVPAWAEKAKATPWHPHHVAERYGLLTIIVIGESVLAAAIAIQKIFEAEHIEASVIGVAVSAPVILYTMWWLYFLFEGQTGGRTGRQAFLWGYVHYFIFASIAAVGAGLALQVDYHLHEAHVSTLVANFSLAVPVAIFLACLPFHIHRERGSQCIAIWITAVLIPGTLWLSWCAVAIAILLTALTAFLVVGRKK